jgi:hypothetical protein
MRGWRSLIGSLVTTVGSVMVLAEFPDRALDLPVGAALIVALAALARSAIRLAGAPAQDDAPAPPRHG